MAARWVHASALRLLPAAFAVYAVAVVVGRATRLEGGALALVWPAAAVGFCWLAASWHDRRTRALSAAALLLLAAVVNALTGAGWLLGGAYAVSNVLQAVVACAVMRHLQSRTGGEAWRLRRSGDLTALAVASLTGSLAAALVGPVALHLSTGAPLLPTMGAWVLRNATSTLAFAALALRLADPQVPRPVRDGRQWLELLGVGVVIAVAYTVVFGLTLRLPLAYLLLPLSMWIALRFSTTVAAGHVLLAGVFVVAATMAGRGPFAIDSVASTVLLAQAYVAVVGLVTLVLALHRDEREAVQRRADEQAALLRTVIDTTSDGISVFGADGRILLRNPAAVELLGGGPTDVPRDEWLQHYGVFRPDGTPLAADELPLTHALAGAAVAGVDVFVRTAAVPDGRMLTMSAHPMPAVPGASWNGGAVMAFHDVTEARAAAGEIVRAHRLLSGVLDASRDFAIVATDLQGRITVFNAGAEALSGYTEAEMLGRTPRRLHDPAEVAARAADLGVEADMGVLVAGLGEQATETQRWTYVHRDGTRTPVSVTVSPVLGADGDVTGYMGVARDLTAELAAAADLADSEQRFRLAFDTAPIGMMMVAVTGDALGTVLRVNGSMTRLLGYAEMDLLGRHVADFTHPDDLALTAERLALHRDGDVVQDGLEKRYVHADGSIVWVRLSTTVVHPHDWEPYSLALLEDITARKAAEAALTHQALHDPLTGLANRALFSDRLQHALAAATRSGERVGVLYLDLDGFKAVNDAAGHAAGDELLRCVAGRLTDCLRPGDTLGRLGGDEFAVVCPGVDPPAGLLRVAERILEALAAPIELAAGTFGVGASIGAGVAELEPGDDPAAAAAGVVAAADEAMYSAKRAGGHRVHSTDEVAPGLPSAAGQLLPELTRALAEGELVLHGQPVLDLGTGLPVAVETLVRWQHPVRGLLSPAAFLGVAETGPLVLALGRRVLDESCRLAAAWSAALGSAAPDVHVNVSGRQLESGTLHDDVVAALARHGVAGDRLVLELTETHMPRVTQSLRADLERLRELGIRIAIDDVGTGYSSLTRLTELPVDVLKIDLAFVAGLGVDPSCDAVVRAILSIGQALGVSVVAEGVETPEQAELLRRYGCDTVQGYLYSRPLAEADLLRRLVQTPVAAPPAQAQPPRGPVRLRCGDVVPGCTRTFSGPQDEVLLAVADHAALAHGIIELPEELIAQVLAALR
nr:EAL domain-containing protein [Kineococcus siccus]